MFAVIRHRVRRLRRLGEYWRERQNFAASGHAKRAGKRSPRRVDDRYALALNRSIAAMISARASAASVQPRTFTNLPGSRSL